MGAVKVHEFMTLDGVVDEPRWTMGYGFDRMGQAIAAAMQGCNAILLGRTTFEMFEPAWSARTAEDDPGAPFFNETAKYVVSGTLTETTWNNSTIVGPYDAAAIRGLKEQVDGDLYVSGSGTLVRALLADRRRASPVRLSAHSRVRPALPGGHAGKLSLAACESYENGVVYLAYRPQV